MTDRKLNEEMARLCGIPKRTSEETFGPGVRKTIAPFICGGTLFSPTDDRRVSERWDPANLFEQAMRYVVPAIQPYKHYPRRFELVYSAKTIKVLVCGCPAGLGWPHRTVATMDAVPRAICEAALEAARKLEETT